MTRSSNTERALRLNAAFDLLAQGYTLADAAEALTQEFGLSRRQAYRFLQEAQVIDVPVLVTSPSIPITIKMPEDVVIQLRSHAQTSGMTIGEIMAHAIVSFLDKLHRRRRSHDIELEYSFSRLHATKLEQVYAILAPEPGPPCRRTHRTEMRNP